MARYTSIALGLQRIYILLMLLVQENNYVASEALQHEYLQKIASDILSSFSDLRHNLHDLAGNTYHRGVSCAYPF